MDRFEPIFEALNATGVRYVVVGGVAVNLHGHQRLTKDLDLVIELVPEQALLAYGVLLLILHCGRPMFVSRPSIT